MSFIVVDEKINPFSNLKTVTLFDTKDGLQYDYKIILNCSGGPGWVEQDNKLVSRPDIIFYVWGIDKYDPTI